MGHQLHGNLSQSIAPLLKLLQSVSMEYMNIEFQRYIDPMNDVAKLWKSNSIQISQLKQTNADNTDYSDALNIITNNEADALKKIEDKVNSEKEELNEKMIEFFANNFTMKEFIQRLCGIIFSLEIHLKRSPSVLLIASKYPLYIEPDDEKKEQNEETKKKNPECAEY